MKKTQNNFGSCRIAKASFLNWISSEIWWKFESMPILSQSFCGSRSLDVLYHLSKPFETRIKRPWLMEGDWVIRGIPPCFGSILLYKYIHIWLIGWVHGSLLLENLGFDMAFDSCRKSRCIHPRFAPQNFGPLRFQPTVEAGIAFQLPTWDCSKSQCILAKPKVKVTLMGFDQRTTLGKNWDIPSI